MWLQRIRPGICKIALVALVCFILFCVLMCFSVSSVALYVVCLISTVHIFTSEMDYSFMFWLNMLSQLYRFLCFEQTIFVQTLLYFCFSLRFYFLFRFFICVLRNIWKIRTVLKSSQKLAVIWKNLDTFEIIQKIGSHLENPDSFEIIRKIGSHLENPDGFKIIRKIGNHPENPDNFEIIRKIGSQLEQSGQFWNHP